MTDDNPQTEAPDTAEIIDMSHEVLINLRKIIRATELYSRKLVKKHGLTGPQLLLLKELSIEGEMTTGDLADRACLSRATVTSILDRLEAKSLVKRTRSSQDKRRVLVELTDLGKDNLSKSPSLLQEQFVPEFNKLEGWEKTFILGSIQRIASMMEAEDIKVQPVLLSGPLAATEMEVNEFYADDEGTASNSSGQGT